MKRHFMFLSLVTSCMLLFGCGGDDTGKPGNPDDPGTENPDDPDDPDDPDNPGGGGSISGSTDPVTIGPEAGDSGTLSLVFGGDWEVKSSSEWFKATPDKGSKGAIRISLEATEANTTTEGRIGEITITSGSNEKKWTVVQLGAKGFTIKDASTTYVSEVSQVKMNIRSNTETFTFDNDGGFVKSYSIAFSGNYEEIGDTGVYSDYRDAVLTIQLNKNPQMDSQREQTMTVKAGKTSEEITIVQTEGRWDTPFYRRSMLLKFTSTGCKFCPYMDETIEEAVTNMPDRIIPVSCYSSDLGGTIVWDMTSYLAGKYGIYSYPAAVFNTIAQLKHSDENAEIFQALAEEAIESYRSYTTAEAESSLSGDKVTLDITVTARTKGKYNLHVWVVEDNVIGRQVTPDGNETSSYEHDHVGRDIITARDGDELNIDARSSKSVSYTYTLSSDIKDKSNAYLVIFTTYSGNPTVRGVTQATYKSYGTIVDNVFTLPLNGSFDLRYED